VTFAQVDCEREGMWVCVHYVFHSRVRDRMYCKTDIAMENQLLPTLQLW